MLDERQFPEIDFGEFSLIEISPSISGRSRYRLRVNGTCYFRRTTINQSQTDEKLKKLEVYVGDPEVVEAVLDTSCAKLEYFEHVSLQVYDFPSLFDYVLLQVGVAHNEVKMFAHLGPNLSGWNRPYSFSDFYDGVIKILEIGKDWMGGSSFRNDLSIHYSQSDYDSDDKLRNIAIPFINHLRDICTKVESNLEVGHLEIIHYNSRLQPRLGVRRRQSNLQPSKSSRIMV